MAAEVVVVGSEVVGTLAAAEVVVVVEVASIGAAVEVDEDEVVEEVHIVRLSAYFCYPSHSDAGNFVDTHCNRNENSPSGLS